MPDIIVVFHILPKKMVAWLTWSWMQGVMGQATKAQAQALRSLYPYHNIGRHDKVGFARLHLSITAA